MSINGGTFTNTSQTVSSGDTVQLRNTSAASAGTIRNAVLTINETTDTYSITTTSSGSGGSGPGGGGSGGGGAIP